MPSVDADAICAKTLAEGFSQTNLFYTDSDFLQRGVIFSLLSTFSASGNTFSLSIADGVRGTRCLG